MRIVIDGTAGCGKTTFLQGKADENSVKATYLSVEDLGHKVFLELIRGAINIRKKRAKDPFDDWDDLFNIVLERGADFYNQAADESKLYFYDRGIPYLKIMALRYGCEVPKKYYEYCEKYRYDSPVFVFEPLKSYDDLKSQQANPIRKKGYTLEERLDQHKRVVLLYRELGYEVVEVPVFADGDPAENNKLRIKYMSEYIKL